MLRDPPDGAADRRERPAGEVLSVVVVLAGGGSARLGRDKLAEPLGGSTDATVLGRLLDDVRDLVGTWWPGCRVRVVGPRRGSSSGFEHVREEPPGGGPVAGLAAGLAGLDLPGDALVAVLAGDQPFAADALGAVVAAVRPDVDGAVALDPDGVRQPLLAVHRLGPLRAAVGEEPAGRSMRSVLSSMRVVEVPVAAPLTLDVDTEDDLARARRHPRRS